MQIPSSLLPTGVQEVNRDGNGEIIILTTNSNSDWVLIMCQALFQSVYILTLNSHNSKGSMTITPFYNEERVTERYLSHYGEQDTRLPSHIDPVSRSSPVNTLEHRDLVLKITMGSPASVG